MRKACAYMRYSSKNQTINSIEYQRAEIQKYCKANGIKIVKEYIDEAMRGADEKRPAFQKMKAAINGKRKWDMVLIYHTSRLARYTKLALDIMEDFYRDRIDVIFTSQPNLNGRDHTTRYHATMQFADDERQSGDTGEMTHAAMAVKAKRGCFLGGIAPLGYDKKQDGDDMIMIIKHDEAKTVKRIFQLYNAGLSFTNMANMLNSEGHRTKNGKLFSKNSFYEILTREKYMGTNTWNIAPGQKSLRGKYQKGDYPVEEQIHAAGTCPAIITKEMFEKAQERIRASKHGEICIKNKRYYMLSGMGVLKCKVCNKPMCGTVVKSHGISYIKYYCPNHKGGHCPTKPIRADRLNKYVAKVVVGEMLRKMSAAELNKLIFTRSYKTGITGKKQRLENKIELLATSLAYRSSKKVINDLANYEEELQALEEKIASGELVVEIEDKTLKNTKRETMNYIAATETGDIRLLLNDVLQEVLVDNDDIEVTLKIA